MKYAENYKQVEINEALRENIDIICNKKSISLNYLIILMIPTSKKLTTIYTNIL